MPAHLITEQGLTSHPVCALSAVNTTSLGRNPNNTLVLADRHVSRWHATIVPRCGRFFLRDQSSVNGTRLDSRLVECETLLQPGQVIRVGGVMLRFEQHATEPLSLDPAWLTANDRAAIHLASTIVGEATFELMPILADALEDAGCDISEVLEHCRSAGPHRHGCWVLELIFPSYPTPFQPPSKPRRLDASVSLG